MSKIAVSPNGSGTGTYTLASPNNNASHTITLPVATGELLVNTATGVDVTGTVTADGLTVDGLSIGGIGGLEIEDPSASGYGAHFSFYDASSEVVIGGKTAGSINKSLSIGRDTGDISFYEDTGTTPKFFWDASTERLGIGNAAPATALDVTGTVAATAYTGDGSALTGTGGLQFISSIDLASDATADFTGFASGTYDSYVFELLNVIPATDAVNFRFRTSTDGGTTYDASVGHYEWANSESRVGTSYTAKGSASSGSTAIQINTNLIGSAAGEAGVSGSLQLFGPHLTQETCCTWHVGVVSSGGNWSNVIGQGARLSAADVNAVRFFFIGNIESGTITMYGKVNS